MTAELSPRMIKLLIHIKDKGFVTKETRPFLTTYRYYGYLWSLRDLGLIECDGTDKNNHQKRWVLSSRGLKVAEMLKGVEEEINES